MDSFTILNEGYRQNRFKWSYWTLFLSEAMFKLLVILFIVKMYSQTDIFKKIELHKK